MNHALRQSLTITALYALCGALWIFFSDRFVAGLQLTPPAQAWLQTYKGWGFVLVTAVLLFVLIHAALRKAETLTRHLRESERTLAALNAGLEARVAERTARLTELTRELEAFTYSVSHDLKAPLRGIDGYGRLLEEECGAALAGECRQFVANIRQGAAQMNALIDDLLAYSHVERRHLQRSDLNLLQLVRSVLAENAHEIAARGVQLDLQVPELTLRADRDGVMLALRNLLSNALKFTREADPARIEVGARCEADHCRLWVRDNGIGFDMRFHDRIFEIFQRLQRTEEYAGTGIGLALVRKALQRMGGRCWAESTPGAGATFYLELPHDT